MSFLRRRGTALLAAVALTLAFAVSGVVAQETRPAGPPGTLTVTVTDRTGGRPVPTAEVAVVGTGLAARTDGQGRARLEAVPGGPQRVRVRALGYEEARLDVVVRAGAATPLSVQLQSRAIALDRLVVTATGRRRTRQVATEVARIDVANVMETAPVTTMSELLTGRASGVTVLPGSGTVGTGARIRLRGSSSISLGNDPVIFLDGVRLETSVESGSIDVGGQVPSRLDDLTLEDIESVEMVKGPSASTLYGTDAANGVVRITTRRGEPGRTRLTAWLEGGVAQDVHDYQANYSARAADGRLCFTFQAVAGACDQAELEMFSPLRDPQTTPFQTGWRQQYGVSVSGGSDRLTYYLSGAWESQDGVYRLPDFERDRLRSELGGDLYAQLPASQFDPNRLDRLSLRANFGGRVWDWLDARVSAGVISSDVRLPQNDNNVLGILPSGMLGYASPDRGAAHGYGLFAPADVFALAVSQELDRVVAGVQLDGRPLDWLELRGSLGLDVATRTDIQDVPRDRVFYGPVFPVGLRDVNTARIHGYTVDLAASARRALTRRLTTRTTVGSQFYLDRFNRADAHGEDIPTGAHSVAAASVTKASETTSESRTLGLYLEEELALDDRLFVTAGLRADDNSAFGADFDVIVYPKLGVSWVLGEAPFMTRWDPLSALRLRAAWGRSGAQPGPTDALRFYQPVAVTADGVDRSGVTFGSLGNADLKPERSSEVEVGFDAGFLDDRLGLRFTWYRKTTTDLLLRQPIPPSAGAGASRFVNLGEVLNRGVEAGLDARVLELPWLRWQVGLNAWANHNELLELGTLPGGDPMPPVKQGTQWFVEGYPLGGYWAKPITYRDADGDGRIVASELTVGVTETYQGSALPDRELSVTSALSLPRGLSLHALAEYRGGYRLRNQGEAFRCQTGICRGLNDPEAPLLEQARALTQTVLPSSFQSQSLFMEDASFWKLRELSATARLPGSWAAGLGADAASVTVAGRNLLTFTDYTGLDPEVNQFGQANFLSRDFMTQPPTRTWSLRVKVEF